MEIAISQIHEVIILSTSQPITCNQTLMVTTHRVFEPDLNEHQTVFGGKILSLVDDSASVAAVRLTHATVVTAAFDHVNFLAPFRLDDSLCLEAYVTGTGKRSLEVFVKVIGENLTTGKRFLGFTCFITYVLDNPAAPTLPNIQPETAEQHYLCAGYAQRYQDRRVRRSGERELTQHLTLTAPWLTD
ncbi:hotdog domain-containing protein [Levilactobacillus zymae]|uniref:acyl-CoA thioesterase n=1 Tax=Levilactobacillus zymae TaxID=267363 RepID=UPI0028B69DBC|nr:hotdog domain-containing protein [Levilactobacillus zymae]MDT6979416.1 hotdog domain-containing protein [Levilactobacillus zymae]